MSDDGIEESTRRVRKYWKWIHLEMIPSKICFFLNDGYFASFSPFLNIFFVSLGLSGTQAGLITGISLAVSVFAGPLWGILADSTNKRRLIFLILCFGTASTVFSMPWIAKVVEKTENNHTCITNHTVGTSNCKYSRHLLNQLDLFYALLVINIIARSFFGALPCYIDGIITNIVNTREQPTSYGAQKVFSPLGFAFFNFLSGVAIDNYHARDMSPYTASFFVFLPCIVCLTPIGYLLVGQSRWETVDSSVKRKDGSVAKQIITVCKQLSTIMFLLSVTVSGIALGIFQGFCFLLIDELHTTKTIMTLAVVACTLSELAIYPFSSNLIKFFRSPIPCIAIGIFSYFPRYMLMSYVENPWLILPIQLFQGIGLSLSWAAQVDHTYKIFPVEVKMSAITIVASIHFVGSGSIANVLGGIIYRDYGARVVFRACAVVCGVWSVLMSIYYTIEHLKAKRQANKTEGISSHVHLEDTNFMATEGKTA